MTIDELLDQIAAREPEEATCWRLQFPVEVRLYLPAGLTEQLQVEAQAKGYGVSDFLALLLDRRYRDWLPPAARRAWRDEVRRRCSHWMPRIYTRRREGR